MLSRMVQSFPRIMVYAGLLLMVAVTFGPSRTQAQAPLASTAVRVYGQTDFTGSAANWSGDAGRDTLNYPLGLAVDASGGVYLADRNNHRVLYYANDGDSLADRVIGQNGDFTAHIANHNGAGDSGAPSPNNMMNPTGIALDAAGGLYVCDRDNHRLLYYAPDGDDTADRVYGQYGSFGVNMTQNDGAGNFGEPGPENFGTYILGVAVDTNGGVYVSDATNHRVLFFANDGDTVADRVYGQYGNMNSGVRNNDGTGRMGTPTAENFNFPRGLAIGPSGELVVADRDNNRILVFNDDGDTVADRVYGQYGDFGMNVETNDGAGQIGTPNADNLSHPKSITFDAAGGLWVADSMHHRVLYFANDGDTTADGVLGQFGSLTSAVINHDGSGNSGSPSADNLNLPQGLVFDAAGNLYVTDTGNNRMLMYSLAQ